ncbi:Ribonuclease H domain [Dillenia turbinata]|uniref:Ribonuclease H domain n=1 Tax=Dillenia turbinata TaxID=194707 RepID=A0AAN8W1F7_9MAGN
MISSPSHHSEDKVIHFINDNREWNLEEFRAVLTEEKVKEIRSLMIPSQITSVLMNFVGLGVLMMSSRRRHFTNEGGCSVCPGIEESILHCLRDCPDAGVKGFSTDGSILDNSNFVAVIWIIWKARCSRNIKNVHMLPMQVARWTISFSSEIKIPISRSPTRKETSEKWVCYSPPMGDNIKLNTDGSVSQSNGHATTGGILRNARGEWVVGFSISVGTCLVLAAELWGVREGLNLASRKGLRNIELEVDSAAMIVDARDSSTFPEVVIKEAIGMSCLSGVDEGGEIGSRSALRVPEKKEGDERGCLCTCWPGWIGAGATETFCCH